MHVPMHACMCLCKCLPACSLLKSMEPAGVKLERVGMERTEAEKPGAVGQTQTAEKQRSQDLQEQG